ncbi:hypothetical protein F480_04710 [Bibersteinia trehalosi Y31]|uniref:Uncharacterized protein n=1 Tax=Bibersteinia trehalosi Y31 TaxID=1261658 RepID=A0A179CY96_BIBTR|nr:hypothetical protein [Bibersteinia trehalosi]OAQ14883.1 hypothetical protein F480_04710 [Bibersteinia trehalosi Y31]
MLQKYIGRVTLCLIISFFITFSNLEKSLEMFIQNNLTSNSDGVVILKYFIINTSILLLSDLVLKFTSEKKDTIAHWKTQCKEMEITYSSLRNKTKQIIHFFVGMIEKSKAIDFSVEFQNEISNHLDSLSEHFDDTDINILKERCEAINVLRRNFRDYYPSEINKTNI